MGGVGVVWDHGSCWHSTGALDHQEEDVFRPRIGRNADGQWHQCQVRTATTEEDLFDATYIEIIYGRGNA